MPMKLHSPKLSRDAARFRPANITYINLFRFTVIIASLSVYDLLTWTGERRFLLTEAESAPREQVNGEYQMSREKTEPVSSSLLHEDEIHDFIAALRKSKRELEIARQQFENVIDPRLIDHVVFRLGAAERHFSYLLQLARQLDISVAGIRWDWAEDAHR
jgi:hypothetical protein